MQKLLVLFLSILVFSCKQSQSNDGLSFANTPKPVGSTTDPNTPPSAPQSDLLLDDQNRTFGTKDSAVADGQLFKLVDGSEVIISSRPSNDVVFSTQLPMASDSGLSGENCVFVSTDCSGSCLIDANHATPLVGGVLLANQLHTVDGAADRIYTYQGEAVSTTVVEVHSRLDLFGDGPSCSTTDVIYDRYYSLDNHADTLPTINNHGWKIQKGE